MTTNLFFLYTQFIDNIAKHLLLFLSLKINNAYRARSGSGCGRYGRVGYITLGLDMDWGLSIRRYVEEAGSVDIRRWEYRIPCWRERGGGRAPGDEEDDGIYDWGLLGSLLACAS